MKKEIDKAQRELYSSNIKMLSGYCPFRNDYCQKRCNFFFEGTIIKENNKYIVIKATCNLIKKHANITQRLES